MQWLETMLTGLGLNRVAVIAGLLGAMVAASKSEGSPTVKVMNFVVGFCFAAWGSSVAVTLFDLPTAPPFYGALGFALGYLGMAVMEAVMVAVNAWKSVDWKMVIERALAKVGL